MELAATSGTAQARIAAELTAGLLEKAVSKLKRMLRKAFERMVSGLWDLIGRMFDLLQPSECANYFSSCGYDPD